MKITIEFVLDSEGLAWIWAQWMYENRSSPCMPDSMALMCEVAEERMRSKGYDKHYGVDHEAIHDDLNEMLSVGIYMMSLETFVKTVARHIENLPEWKG